MSDKKRVTFTEAEMQFMKKLDAHRERAENKFPLTTALVATFGFVSLLYGFEKFIDRISFLSNNPIVLFIVGIVILTITGSIYKKLG